MNREFAENTTGVHILGASGSSHENDFEAQPRLEWDLLNYSEKKREVSSGKYTVSTSINFVTAPGFVISRNINPMERCQTCLRWTQAADSGVIQEGSFELEVRHNGGWKYNEETYTIPQEIAVEFFKPEVSFTSDIDLSRFVTVKKMILPRSMSECTGLAMHDYKRGNCM